MILLPVREQPISFPTDVRITRHPVRGIGVLFSAEKHPSRENRALVGRSRPSPAHQADGSDFPRFPFRLLRSPAMGRNFRKSVYPVACHATAYLNDWGAPRQTRLPCAPTQSGIGD